MSQLAALESLLERVRSRANEPATRLAWVARRAAEGAPSVAALEPGAIASAAAEPAHPSAQAAPAPAWGPDSEPRVTKDYRDLESAEIEVESVEIEVDSSEITIEDEDTEVGSVEIAMASDGGALPEAQSSAEALEIAADEVGLSAEPSPAAAPVAEAPIIDVPTPSVQASSTVVSSASAVTVRRELDPVRTTAQGMPPPLARHGDSHAPQVSRSTPPPLPTPEAPAGPAEDLDATVAVTAPPAVPEEAKAAGLTPRVVTPSRDTSAQVGEFIGEIEGMPERTFGDVVDAALDLAL